MAAPQMLAVHQRLLGPTAMTAAATQTANLDTVTSRGKTDKVSINLIFAAEVNTSAVGPTISLLHSDDTVATNFVTVVANRTDEDLAAAKILRYNVDCQGLKRYLRISVTTATHTTNDVITLAAMATRHHLDQEPGTTTQMMGSTSDAVVTVSS